MRRLELSAFAVVLLAAAACNHPTEPPAPAPVAVARIVVTPPNTSMAVGATQQLSVAITDASGNPLTGRPIGWASSNAIVATVSASGLVTAIASGAATISATTGGVIGTASVIVPVVIAITSVSSATPLPLTAIHLTTTGLNLNASVFVRYSSASGFSSTSSPIRLGSDGTLTAAVPLYVDPTTGKTAAHAVSLMLMQGTDSSKVVPLTIGDLPSVPSYGLPAGQITHMFLQYSAIRLARVIGDLQAFSALPGNNVDVSGEVANLQAMLTTTIEARGDYDQIALNPGLSYDLGVLPNGVDLRFNASSLDMMDRTIGLYLTELTPIILQAGGASLPQFRPANGAWLSARSWSRGAGTSFRVRASSPHFGAGGQPALRLGSQTTEAQSATATGGSLGQVLDILTNANKLTGYALALQAANASDKSPMDYVLAALGGAAVLSGSAQLGALSAGLSLTENLAEEIDDLAIIGYAAFHGNDPVLLQVAQANLSKNQQDAWWNLAATELSLGDVALGGPGKALQTFVRTRIGIGIQGGEILVGGVQFINADGLKQLNTLVGTLASKITGVFGSSTQGCAELRGTATIANDQGSYLAGQTGIAVGPFEVQGSNVTAVSDPSGHYNMCIPLLSPNTNYVSLHVSAFDPVTGSTLGSFLADFSAVRTGTITTLPTLSGTCVDGDLDGDDPDCDSPAPMVPHDQRAGAVVGGVGLFPAPLRSTGGERRWASARAVEPPHHGRGSASVLLTTRQTL